MDRDFKSFQFKLHCHPCQVMNTVDCCSRKCSGIGSPDTGLEAPQREDIVDLILCEVIGWVLLENLWGKHCWLGSPGDDCVRIPEVLFHWSIFQNNCHLDHSAFQSPSSAFLLMFSQAVHKTFHDIVFIIWRWYIMTFFLGLTETWIATILLETSLSWFCLLHFDVWCRHW